MNVYAKVFVPLSINYGEVASLYMETPLVPSWYAHHYRR